LCKRKSDGKFFKASYPKTPKEGNPFSNMLNGKAHWFFRHVEKKGWWIFSYWAETGEVWVTDDYTTFDIISTYNPNDYPK
ncbi:hypothetical protein KAR91_17805, partial [Candidatus Pacearchaeota archaeon]|nr:hypothetical protein [Candidatus Pacearchaeota archaeon]